MMVLENILTSINHSRERRSDFAEMALKNPALLPELLDICNKVDHDISCRACWGLEFVAKSNLNLILPHLDTLLAIIPTVYKHSAVRPMAKICEYLTLSYYKTQHPDVHKKLTAAHRKQITEICFDWMITDQKIAPQAYSMTSLYLLGTEFDWVHPELKTILENNYHTGSAAYKARARKILSKLIVNG